MRLIKPKSHFLSWYMVYRGISWYIVVYRGISWYIMVYGTCVISHPFYIHHSLFILQELFVLLFNSKRFLIFRMGFLLVMSHSWHVIRNVSCLFLERVSTYKR